jgi:hypothetical protein
MQPKRVRAKKQKRLNTEAKSYQGYFKMREGQRISHTGAMERFEQSSSSVSCALSTLLVFGYFDVDDPDKRCPIYIRTEKTPPVDKWEKKPRRKYGPRKPVNQRALPFEVRPAHRPKPEIIVKDIMAPIAKTLEASKIAKTLEVTRTNGEVTLTFPSGLRMIGTKEQIAEKLIDEL